MKTTSLLFLSLALVSSAYSAVVQYSDVSLSQSGATSASQVLSVSPDHTFFEPNTDNATSMPRYYGGTLSYTGALDWGTGARLYFSNADAPSSTNYSLQIGITNPAVTSWRFMGSATGVTTTTLNFVVKMDDSGYNQSTFSLFLGTSATAATEGTPIYTTNTPLGVGNPTSVTTMFFALSGGNSFTATNLFSSTEWNPVGSGSQIPEPSTYALLGGLAALGFVASRRRR